MEWHLTEMPTVANSHVVRPNSPTNVVILVLTISAANYQCPTPGFVQKDRHMRESLRGRGKRPDGTDLSPCRLSANLVPLFSSLPMVYPSVFAAHRR